MCDRLENCERSEQQTTGSLGIRLWHAKGVTELSDLLELLVGADDSFRTVKATIRSWRDDVKYGEAFERHAEEQERRSGASGAVLVLVGDDGAEEESEPAEEVVRIWLEPPDRVRVELEGRWTQTMVSNGPTTWSYTPEMGAVREERGARGQAEAPLLLQPAVLIAGLDFDSPEKTELVGREALHVRARPRPAGPMLGWHDLHGLAQGADEYDLVVDAERGILLRAAALMDGEEFATSEVTEIAFDEQLEPERFTFTPPPGETVRTPEEAFGGEIEDVSIEEAARRAPFTVFVATKLGPHWTMDVHFHGKRERPPMPVTVFVHYSRTDDGLEQFGLSERARRENEAEPGSDWERVDRAGQALYVYMPSEQKRRWPSLIRFERDGTWIELSSQSFERERLLEIAASLAPAPTEPPLLRSR